MCGRTACALDPDTICDACTYKGKDGKRQRPIWKDNKTTGNQFRPSYNISPGQHTPVMLSSKHYASELEPVTERVIQPMYWGLVPSWHKGDPKKVAYGTNNCKSETMLEKKTFKTPLEKGRRCVVLAEGFYEWKKEASVKQPYFFSSIKLEKRDGTPDIKPGNDLMKADQKDHEIKTEKEIKSELSQDETTDKDEKETEESPNPILMMAGVFDIWRQGEGPEPLYSYSVLTVSASSVMNNIHHRMPAILSSEEDVEKWLNFGEVPLKEAARVIKPQTCLKLYPVSRFVNNSQNNSPECIKPIELKKPKNLLTNWLSGSENKLKQKLKKEEKAEEEEIASKEIKLEKE